MGTIDILKIGLNIAELTACITGFLYWKKIKTTHWSLFPVYLGIIVLGELAGKYFYYTSQSAARLGLYNFFLIPLQVLFFMWLFYREFGNKTVRRLAVLTAVVYILCWAADMFIIHHDPTWWIRSFSYTAGILLLLVLILVYVYKMATSNDILFIKTNMMFWVCIGLFVFYFCSLPFFGIGNYLFANHGRIYTVYAYGIYVLNMIMYSFFVIAFICGKPR